MSRCNARGFRTPGFRLGLLGFLLIWSLSIHARVPSSRPAGSVAPELLDLAYRTPQASVRLIVQDDGRSAAEQRAAGLGGTVEQRFEFIDAFVVTLPAGQIPALASSGGVLRITADGVVRTVSDESETYTGGYLLYPSAASGVTALHQRKVMTPKSVCKDSRVTRSTDREERLLRGWGVTVAVIDSGLLPMSSTSDWKQDTQEAKTLFASNSGRCLIYRDFLPRSTENANYYGTNSVDQYGHGAHVAATIADARTEVLVEGGKETPIGVAPAVNLMVARALDKNGSGTYSAVINAIEWVLRNKTRFNVRVLNLSLYAPVSGPYWADPLNQAVMRAWQSGIVVVAAAGNQGPSAATITVPGNVPYVITVGAVRSGRYTETGQDELAPYSSRGPTESAFVKPDVLVPGSRTIAPMPANSTLAQQFPEAALVTTKEVDFNIGSFKGTHSYYQLSGTSMSTAQVSGIVALMLQTRPNLTNNQVKYRLLSTTSRATIPGTDSEFYYSVWEQGAGLVDAERAFASTATEHANAGMDIALDLDTTSDPQTHYWGNTTWDEASGVFQLVDPDTAEVVETWDEGLASSSGYRLWSGGYRLWSGGYRLWSGGYRLWSGGTDAWSGGYRLWSGGYRLWSGSTGTVDGGAAMHGGVLQTP